MPKGIAQFHFPTRSYQSAIAARDPKVQKKARILDHGPWVMCSFMTFGCETWELTRTVLKVNLISAVAINSPSLLAFQYFQYHEHFDGVCVCWILIYAMHKFWGFQWILTGLCAASYIYQRNSAITSTSFIIPPINSSHFISQRSGL